MPADMPDQQVQDGEDPMDVPPPPSSGPDEDDAHGAPDPDESGSGRGAPRNAGVHPEHPVPDESPG
ncbi:hypothetical protein E6P78_05675 [Streptomyces sp. A0958]|nr:hypothetical protein E6P78_05675 [Streptomyces sp. A0958]